jgi:transcriptional regulator with XRE-family HTH domain
MKTTNIGENLKRIRISKGWTRDRIEKISGIKNLYQKEVGLRRINENDIIKLSEALQCTKAEIVGDFDDSRVETYNKTKMVKRYVMDSMKINSITDIDNIKDRIPVSETFLRDNIKSDNIIIIKYYGNYMFPYFLSNDDLYVDVNNRNFVNNGVFLIKDSDTGCAEIRRVYKPELYKDIIILTYDNRETTGIQTTQINEENFNKLVCGRVVYYGRNIL